MVSNTRSGQISLDDLYSTAISASLDGDKRTKDRFLKILALILLSKIPLSDEEIDGVLDLKYHERSAIILSRLQSLVSYRPRQPILLYHASFYDFLTAVDRSGEWFIDITWAKEMFALRCFEVMPVVKSLHFNMGELDSTSFIRNDVVEGLEERLSKTIPPYLRYVCLSWPQHLQEAPFTIILCDKLSLFVHRYLL